MKKLTLGRLITLLLIATPIVNGQTTTIAPCPVANSATAVCKVTNMPEPSTFLLLGCGLVVLAVLFFFGRKRSASAHK